ncbi:endonuclease domain-containing protein [Leifsonia poae]|uniref:endonuclease domain-containing protein n=1 Tax=Leifsonia poae TaxID=110933 RepID=UPI001CBF90FE|nr:hypothetical protein [Leifsonia poae]
MRTPQQLPTELRFRTFTPAEARRHGVSDSRLRNRDLHRPFHGVVAARHDLDLTERCRACAQTIVGGFFSGPTAAALRGVPLPRLPDDVHVSVPAPRRAPRSAGVVGHSVRIRPGDVTVSNGLPLSSTERMWCELAEALSLEELVVAGDHLVATRAPTTTVEALRAALTSYPGRRGRGRLVGALDLIDPAAESPQESRLRVRLLQAGIGGFVANPPLHTSSGRRYRGDLVFPASRVVLEYQGDHHREPQAYRSDLSRQLDLQADGWQIVQLGPEDIADEGLGRRIRAVLALRSHRRVTAELPGRSWRAG